MSYFTCLGSFVLLLFTFSRTGHTYVYVETIANAVWLANSHLVIFVPFSCGLFSLIFMMYLFIGSGWRSLRLVVLVFGLCSEFCGCVLLLAVGCLLLCDCYDWSCWFSRNVLALWWSVTLYCRLLVITAIVMSGRTGFREMSWTLQWCVTLSGSLLVISAIVMSGSTGFREMPWTLWWCVTLSGRLLVITASVTSGRTGFREMSWTLRWCVTLSGRLLVITASVTSGRTGFRFRLLLCMLLAVNWAVGFVLRKNVPFSCFLVIPLLSDVLSFVAMAGGAVSWVVWDNNCKNLVDRCARETFCKVYYLFYAALTLRAGLASLGSWWRIRRHYLSCGPILRRYHVQNVISFFLLHVLSVGRDTELYSGVSLNYECGRWVWPCSGSSGHWVWSDHYLANAIIERIAFRQRNVRLDALQF